MPVPLTSSSTCCKFKFKFNEATPRGVPGPVFKKTPEMPGFTKMTTIMELKARAGTIFHNCEKSNDGNPRKR